MKSHPTSRGWKISTKTLRAGFRVVAAIAVLLLVSINVSWKNGGDISRLYSTSRQLRSEVDGTLPSKDRLSKSMIQQLLSWKKKVFQDPSFLDHEHNSSIFSNEQALPLRVLYIMTSSSKSFRTSNVEKHPSDDGKRSRWSDMIVPILQHNVESFYRNSNEDFQVDVYLITSYAVNETEIGLLRNALPTGTGLQIWQDATPLSYNCLDYDQHGIGERCQHFNTSDRYKGKMEYNFSATNLRQASAQLSRQHRYVVKDKLPYYDFFVVLEDDMIVTESHVSHHRDVMTRIRMMEEEQQNNGLHHKDAKKDRKKSNSTQHQSKNPSWNVALKKDFLKRVRPGFVRVEVLQKESERIKEKRISQLDGKTTIGEEYSIDPSICCDIPDHIRASEVQMNHHPKKQHVVVWETNLAGFKLRPWAPLEYDNPQNSSWMAATVSGTKGFPAYWTGRSMDPQPRRPAKNDPKYMAQSAGWMGSPKEIMEYQMDLCVGEQTHHRHGHHHYGRSGSFLPPYDPLLFKRDGLWRNNVEFWSGGIQLWGGMCEIQRVLLVDNPHDFSKHLIYHASNNKQHKIDKKRLIPAQTLWEELSAVKSELTEKILGVK